MYLYYFSNAQLFLVTVYTWYSKRLAVLRSLERKIAMVIYGKKLLFTGYNKMEMLSYGGWKTRDN